MPQISENIIRRIGKLAPEFHNSTVLYLSPLEFCVASINTINKNQISIKNTLYNKGQGLQALTGIIQNETSSLKYSALVLWEGGGSLKFAPEGRKILTPP